MFVYIDLFRTVLECVCRPIPYRLSEHVGLSCTGSVCRSASQGGKTEDIDHQLLLQLGQHGGGEDAGVSRSWNLRIYCSV